MLGIIGAMEEEVADLVRDMQVTQVRTQAGMTFNRGKLEGKDVVVVRSGIGKVNAAVCAQIMCDAFHVNAIINTGVAGSLDAKINIGDIVLSSDVVHHDMDATGFGYPMGQIPRMNTLAFKANESLIGLARIACARIASDVDVYVGRIVSGDQFVSDLETKRRIAENFGGYCTEMEGAAIAQTAYLNDVPFLIIRAISDKADDSAQMDYSEFEAMAIRNLVSIVERIAKTF